MPFLDENGLSRLWTNIVARLNGKMSSENPEGTGSFSMNRKAGSTIGEWSHAEGMDTIASGKGSHAEGVYVYSAEDGSVEAYSTAQGIGSHAEGAGSKALGDASHAEGVGTIAASMYQHVQGMLNIEDADDTYAHIVGNGNTSTGSIGDAVRSNAHTLDWDGNAWFQGDVYVGSTSGTNKDDGSVKLATMNDVNPIVTTSGSGAAYVATVPGITSLTAGVKFTMIPHTVSTSTAPKLNVNGLGEKSIRRRVSNSTVTTVAGSVAGWIGANKPVEVMYDGTYWVVDFIRPNATDIYGTLPIASGGTGATTAASALTNLGAMPDVAVTSADAGKFLRVSADGVWVAESIPTASGVNF